MVDAHTQWNENNRGDLTPILERILPDIREFIARLQAIPVPEDPDQ